MALGHASTEIKPVAEWGKWTETESCTRTNAETRALSMLQVSHNHTPSTNALQRCTLTYFAHGGFGNQVRGLQRAFQIARAAGCALELPPVLNHFDLVYQCRDCASGVEPDFWQSASQIYEKRDLKYEHIFELSPRLRAHMIHDTISAPHDLRSRKALPIDCTSIKHLGFREMKRKLREFIHEHGFLGRYSIGSSFCMNTPKPRPPLADVFADFAPKVRAAVEEVTRHLTRSHNMTQYGCIHLRSGDHKGDNQLKRSLAFPQMVSSVNQWITKHVSFGSSSTMPLFLMSGMPKNTTREWVRTICNDSRHGWSSCKTLSEVFPDFASLDLGLPDQAKNMYQQLVLELGICSRAARIFLPSRGKTIVDGHASHTESSGLHDSTLSRFIEEMATRRFSSSM